MSFTGFKQIPKNGLALQKVVDIHSSILLHPPMTTNKTGVSDLGSSLYLLSKPAPPELPQFLAGTALLALKNGRPWNNDESQFVADLLEECSKRSTQSFRSFVKQRQPNRSKGRPVSTRPTRRDFNLGMIGRRIDELIAQGMLQAEARKQGVREFSLSPRAIDNHHAKHKKLMKKVNAPETREAQRANFVKNYLGEHSKKRQEFRARGRKFRYLVWQLKSTGSVLKVRLHLSGRSTDLGYEPVQLTIPPSDVDQCRALLVSKQSIHGALLH